MRLLEQHPEWRAEFRRLLLSEELLSLPDLVKELAEAQRRTEERLHELTEAQRHTQIEILQLTRSQSDAVERLKRTERQLADVLGWELEHRCRERAAGYFQDLLRRIWVIDHQTLGFQLDDAVDAGLITRRERDEVLRLDLVVQGRHGDEEAYLAVEVSSTVDDFDVRRAAERAALLAKAVGRRVIPVVAGNEFAANVAEEAARRNVVCLLDGRVVQPA